MNIEPVESPIAKSLDELHKATEQEAKLKEATEKVKKYMELLKRFRSGALTFLEYKSLGQGARRQYRKLHGQPHSKTVRRTKEKKQENRRIRNRMAKTSRAINLRVAAAA